VTYACTFNREREATVRDPPGTCNWQRHERPHQATSWDSLGPARHGHPPSMVAPQVGSAWAGGMGAAQHCWDTQKVWKQWDVSVLEKQIEDVGSDRK
jgi:hypothetical protein